MLNHGGCSEEVSEEICGQLSEEITGRVPESNKHWFFFKEVKHFIRIPGDLQMNFVNEPLEKILK